MRALRANALWARKERSRAAPKGRLPGAQCLRRSLFTLLANKGKASLPLFLKLQLELS